MRIAIIGAGFSGTSLALTLQRFTSCPIEIILFDKSGYFGAGAAYSTPFPFHLLNIRAREMSLFEDQPDHFVNWLQNNSLAADFFDKSIPIAKQFAPRFLYRNYLQHFLGTILSAQNVTIKFEPIEVIDSYSLDKQACLLLKDNRKIYVDKVILAIGNSAPVSFPFTVPNSVHSIVNPWDYEAVKQIPSNDSVLILGTGLSMIDSVLTLYHQQHQGHILAVSRHGLVPLPHEDSVISSALDLDGLPRDFSTLTKFIRTQCRENTTDWRSIINALRPHVVGMWQHLTLVEKKRFLRHLLPYWNVHRHRVHKKIADLLFSLQQSGQFEIKSGRVVAIKHQQLKIKLRKKNEIVSRKVNWIINCLGPAMDMQKSLSPFLHSLLQRGLVSLDPLNLGFAIASTGGILEPSGNVSSLFYSLGPPCKGVMWECIAVPEIRKQTVNLTKTLLDL